MGVYETMKTAWEVWEVVTGRDFANFTERQRRIEVRDLVGQLKVR